MIFWKQEARITETLSASWLSIPPFWSMYAPWSLVCPKVAGSPISSHALIAKNIQSPVGIVGWPIIFKQEINSYSSQSFSTLLVNNFRLVDVESSRLFLSRSKNSTSPLILFLTEIAIRRLTMRFMIDSWAIVLLVNKEEKTFHQRKNTVSFYIDRGTASLICI